MATEKNFEFSNRQRTLIMIPVLLGGFIACLNETLLNVAFPQLMSSLHVSLEAVQWLATAYMLIIGILVPVSAFLLETFTTKRLYLMAMILFTVGTFCCALSPSFPVLLVSRLLQGVGSGIMIPIIMYTILAIYPPARRGTAMGISMLVVVLAPTFGPTLSGLILHHLSWSALFWIILPLGIIAIVLGTLNMVNISSLAKPKIDVLSIILSTIGFGGLLFGVSSMESKGFLNTTVLVSLLCGIVALIVFSKHQFTLPQPMLELGIFRFPMFTLGTIITFIIFMVPFAAGIILPTYMQAKMGMTPFTAGLALLPGGIFATCTMPLSGIIYDKIGVKLLATVGFVILAVTMFFFAHISATTGMAALIVLHICMTTSIALIIAPMQTNSLNQLSAEYHAHGVVILNTTQQIAAATGSTLYIGLMGAMQARYLAQFPHPGLAEQQAAMISGADTAFTAAFIVVVIGLILSFFVKRPEKQYTTAADKVT